MNRILQQLDGGDLRSTGAVDRIVPTIVDQASFDLLFEGLFADDRLIAMRAADAVEKVTRRRPEFLESHQTVVLSLFAVAMHKEFKWHLAQLASRLPWDEENQERIWSLLATWAKDRRESRIVRVNALQSLFELTREYPARQAIFEAILVAVEAEEIPSLQARIRRLRRSKKEDD